MPAPQFQSEESARQCIEDMLSALAEEESPGFSKFALGPNLRLVDAKRITGDDGKSIQSVVKIRMEVDEKMANQMANLHGELTDRIGLKDLLGIGIGISVVGLL